MNKPNPIHGGSTSYTAEGAIHDMLQQLFTKAKQGDDFSKKILILLANHREIKLTVESGPSPKPEELKGNSQKPYSDSLYSYENFEARDG